MARSAWSARASNLLFVLATSVISGIDPIVCGHIATGTLDAVNEVRGLGPLSIDRHGSTFLSREPVRASRWTCETPSIQSDGLTGWSTYGLIYINIRLTSESSSYVVVYDRILRLEMLGNYIINALDSRSEECWPACRGVTLATEKPVLLTKDLSVHSYPNSARRKAALWIVSERQNKFKLIALVIAKAFYQRKIYDRNLRTPSECASWRTVSISDGQLRECSKGYLDDAKPSSPVSEKRKYKNSRETFLSGE
ncbi:hypothetical protein J6590_001067 [Homalodisca vitripennis]|nr:hypothetical protein J6590_001067 [Homalodisca vitripennis]